MAELVTLLDDASDLSGLALAETGDVLNDLRVNGDQEVQLAGALRAANARAFNRGNVVNRVTVGVTYAPAASPDAAKQAAVDLVADLTAKIATATLLDLVFGSIQLRLSDAALERYDIYPRGTTVFASYSFVGGALAEVVAP